MLNVLETAIANKTKRNKTFELDFCIKFAPLSISDIYKYTNN